MHIAFYSPAWPPEGVANGVVTYVATLRDYLINSGHRVSIVTTEGIFLTDGSLLGPMPEPAPVRGTLLALWDRFTHDTALVGHRLKESFRHLHGVEPVDVIEMEESFGWFHEVAKIGVPVVVRLHGPYFCSPGWEDKRTRNKWSVRRERREALGISRATAITSPSIRTLEATVAQYHPRAPVQEVIPNPVVVSAEDDLWSVSESDPDQLLWVGYFSFAKGADLMLEAFELLLRERPNLRLHMVGPDRRITIDGEVMDFEAYCRRYFEPHVRQQITYHGVLKPAQIVALRRQAGLSVTTSRAEVFPYTVIEAMALGAPIISTPWPGFEGILTDGRTGWVAREMSGTAVAAAIAAALADDGERQRIGRDAWHHAQEKLSPEAIGARTLRLYLSLPK